MFYETIIYEKKQQVAYITLNRPTVNAQLATELAEVCHQINEDNGARVVIITGAANGAFSIGEDLTEFPFTTEPSLVELKEKSPVSAASRAIASLDLPAIAAINGDALGGGLELALSCDIRIAAQKARFGFPNTSLGLIPQGGGTQRLPRIVGKGKALEMILTADPIDASEAYRIGLVNKVVAVEALIPAVEELAKLLISRGPIAVKYAKEAINKGLDMTLEQGLRLEADLNIVLQTTQDRAEGVRAFLEKRPPIFRGE